MDNDTMTQHDVFGAEGVQTDNAPSQQTQVETQTKPVDQQTLTQSGDAKTEVKPEAKPEPKTDVRMSKEDLADAIARATTATQPKPEPKKLTEDEIKTQLKYYKVTEDDLAELAEGGPKALAAYQRMLDGQAQHAFMLAQIAVQQARAEIESRIAPHISFAEQAQLERAKNDYFHENPTHAGLEPLIQQVATTMTQEGFKGSRKEIFAEVAKRVDKLADTLKIPRGDGAASGDAGAGGNADGNKDAKTRMSTVSAGGQGQAGNSKTTSTTDTVEDKIWG